MCPNTGTTKCKSPNSLRYNPLRNRGSLPCRSRCNRLSNRPCNRLYNRPSNSLCTRHKNCCRRHWNRHSRPLYR